MRKLMLDILLEDSKEPQNWFIASEDEIRHDKLYRFSNVATITFQALMLIKWNQYAMLLAKYYLKIHGLKVTILFQSERNSLRNSSKNLCFKKSLNIKFVVLPRKKKGN